MSLELSIKWVPVKDEKPETNEKHSESEDVLCFTENETCFVGWYNSDQDQWFVSHYLAQSTPLQNDYIPVLWAKLDFTFFASLKNSRV